MIKMIRRRSRVDVVSDTHSEASGAAAADDSTNEAAQTETDAVTGIHSPARDDASSSICDEGSADDEAPAANSSEQAQLDRESLQEPSPDDDAEGRPADAKAQTARTRCKRLVALVLLPGIAMLATSGAGYLKRLQANARETQDARIESVQAATESTIKILSYSPDSVDRDLDSARDRLTGTFRDAYTQLIHAVVIPGSKDKKISAVATVPAATSISAAPSHAVVMVFVNQSIMVGNDPPSSSASSVRVTMDKHDNRWLISDFTPI